MALIWQKTIQGVHYEVRSAGQTRRLYTDGVFHSQYNPNHILTGGIWDLLMLPALFYPTTQIKRVLVLGVGGGAVIRLLKSCAAPESIIGVDLDQQHISLARRFFGVKGKTVNLVHAEAVHWLQHYSGPPFDMIVDDLFGEQAGEPVRAVALDKKWFTTLNRNLMDHGVIVANTVAKNELNNCAFFSSPSVAGMFKSAYTMSLPTYENTVAAFFKTTLTKKHLTAGIASLPENACKKAIQKMKFQLRKLNPTHA
jgi:spermidine synthase